MENPIVDAAAKSALTILDNVTKALVASPVHCNAVFTLPDWLLQTIVPVVIGINLVESKSCDHFLVDANCTPIVPVVGNEFTVVNVIIRSVGDVYTVLGLKVNEQVEPAGVIVTLLLLPATVYDVSVPIVPEKTEVWPAGYGFKTLPTIKLKVFTKTLLNILLKVMVLPDSAHEVEVYTPVLLME